MIKRIDMSSFIYILMMLFMFLCGTAMSQDFITTDNFKNKIAKDVVVIEFWADWNQMNQFNELNKLKGCNTYRWTFKLIIMLQLSRRLLYLIMASRNVDLILM